MGSHMDILDLCDNHTTCEVIFYIGFWENVLKMLRSSGPDAHPKILPNDQSSEIFEWPLGNNFFKFLHSFKEFKMTTLHLQLKERET